MLSNVNLIHILGRRVGIYPFDASHIEGASIDLTASCYAWSLKDKKSIVERDEIVIKPKDTAIIFTNEAISFDKNHAGICLNRMSFSIGGINHSSSPLKPGYTGRLSVAIYNSSDSDFTINVGEPILVIMMFKLRRHANATVGNGYGSRLDILASLGIQIDEHTRRELVSYDDRDNLLRLMKGDIGFKEYKKCLFKIRRIPAAIVAVLIILSFVAYAVYAHKTDELVLIVITAVVAIVVSRLEDWLV